MLEQTLGIALAFNPDVRVHISTLLSGTYFKSTPNSSEANRAQNLALKWTRLLQILMMTCLMVVHTTPLMEQC